MKNLKIDIKHIANLAKLELTEDEAENMKKTFSEISEILKVMEEINVDGHEFDTSLEHLRKDEEGKSFDKDEMLKNAPESCDGYFTVSRVVG